MIVAFVGTVEDESDTPISGNGKTNAMVYVSYIDYLQKGKTIWTNFKTDYSEQMGMQKMIESIGDEPQTDLVLCVSEMQRILNSLGSDTKKVLFIEKFASQLRKLNVDLYYDTQRFKNIHLRLRSFTDIIFIPKKYHFDRKPCNYNLCMKPHMICLYSAKPYNDNPIVKIDATKVGKHYDSNEIIFDKLVLEEKRDV